MLYIIEEFATVVSDYEVIAPLKTDVRGKTVKITELV